MAAKQNEPRSAGERNEKPDCHAILPLNISLYEHFVNFIVAKRRISGYGHFARSWAKGDDEIRVF
ncbi:hypothetical protein [Cohnella thermotolerans]|uniref:hypothetical protein n=1 Tax=Cohnella thermotolerans TaxID=329858 RepID=UPI00146FC153|nr:hypothetical protein [Cohnella thermotolerans]